MTDTTHKPYGITAVPYTPGMEDGFTQEPPNWIDPAELVNGPDGPFPYLDDDYHRRHFLTPDDCIVTYAPDNRRTVKSRQALVDEYRALREDEIGDTVRLIHAIAVGNPCPANCPNIANKPADEGCGQDVCLEQIEKLSARLLPEQPADGTKDDTDE